MLNELVVAAPDHITHAELNPPAPIDLPNWPNLLS
ncbi:hypothetical protein J2X01_000330 [Arthrobacter ginsengisoli]|uniref:Uncharacterized protein n=1 Tax=Arthrobacter ginsengisoli TaxID=1356565 RepID=A0ABU1U7A1_9MICC|nr:hypothetical protein [Arthrobacter ginsengisoli]